MAIYNRGGYWHFDFQAKGDRFRGSTRIPATTKAVPANVRAWVKNYRERALLGEVSRAGLTIAAAADKWFAARADGKKSAKTTAFRIVIMLRHIGADTMVSAIDDAAVEAAIQSRRLEPTRQSSKKNVRFPANATVNRDIIDTLRPILRYAKKYLRQSVQDIEWTDLRLAQPRERVREFTADELTRWLAKLPAWHHAPHAFMQRYGTRLRETFSFPPSAFDGERVVIEAKDRKNARAHVIPILPAHRADIASRASRAAEAGLATIWFREVVADGETTLQPVHWRAFQSASKKALQEAGIRNARPAHDLRHHAATQALRRSKNLGAVKKLLGHDNIQSTMRYAHSNEDDVLEALGHKIHHNESGGENRGEKETVT